MIVGVCLWEGIMKSWVLCFVFGGCVVVIWGVGGGLCCLVFLFACCLAVCCFLVVCVCLWFVCGLLVV